MPQTSILSIAILLCFAGTSLPARSDAGALDRPLLSIGVENPDKPGVVSSSPAINLIGISDPAQVQQQLRDAVSEEQQKLEQLDRVDLLEKAEDGERAAQVVLGEDYAKEASLLSFAPAAANDALSDAVRWYSVAASRGFPGAPSLDQAGIRFYPIRIQREPLR